MDLLGVLFNTFLGVVTQSLGLEHVLFYPLAIKSIDATKLAQKDTTEAQQDLLLGSLLVHYFIV